MRTLALLVVGLAATGASYKDFLTGNSADRKATTRAGFALIGGAKDVDEFYKWMIARSGGGDMVVIRASGSDGYNDYLYQLGGLDSVETLVIDNPQAAQDSSVVEKINDAEALFIAGGDQWKYVSIWNHSPVGQAMQAAIERGIPIGGTSAGLAILGQYIYTAEKDTVTSSQALADPFDEHVTVGTDFLNISFLRNTITDTHFKARDRMGRTLTFLARMMHDNQLKEARGIAIDERTAALVENDGTLRVAGFGHVYFLRVQRAANVCERGKPLTMRGIQVYREAAGNHFDLNQWRGEGGSAYQLAVEAGKITSDQPGGNAY